MISVHVEVLPHLHRTVHAIKALGVKAGVVINPATPVGAIEPIARDVDYVLVMSVNPGFGGQKFIQGSEAKVQAVRSLLDRLQNPAPVEIDGGIDFQNVGGVVGAGARIVVAGSAIFTSPDPAHVARNPEQATRELKIAALAGASARSTR
jgi:ribulose-phosphate 3-epimerase